MFFDNRKQAVNEKGRTYVLPPSNESALGQT
jgi:hypothetical protein